MRFSTLFLVSLAAGFTNAKGFPTRWKSNATSDVDPVSTIKNLLSQYCIILDTKAYEQLNMVYTSDAVANFSTIGLGVLDGLANIQVAMNSSLFGIPTQHGMSTSFVTGRENGTAEAISYYTLQQFGTGNKTNQLFTVWGKWEDSLVMGSDGWRIQNRQVVAMGGPLMGNFILPTH